jgi:2-polyprenyl-6-methoxyphenol hydroxylase-like FAD-dependent oxidoreductase
VRAVVVGGGIGGLAAAIALRQAGLDVVVLEQATRLEQVGAGLVVAQNALRALAAIGLADEVARRGELGGRLVVRRADGRALLDLNIRSHGEEVLGIHRAELQDALLEALPGEAVRLATRCVGVDAHDSRVAARLADGGVEEGDLVVGADGIRSVVRAELRVEGPPRYAGYAGWRMVVPAVGGVEPVTFSESWGRGLRVGIVPIGRGQVYWFVSESAAEGASHAGPGSKERFLELLDSWHDPIPALVEATPEQAMTVTDVHDRKPSRQWGRGRVTLLGDAAHAMTPNLGQGACQALEDAVVLGRALEETRDVEAALRRYEERRRSRANRIVARSRQAGRLAQAQSPIGCWLRDTLTRLTPERVAIAQRERMAAFDPAA